MDVRGKERERVSVILNKVRKVERGREGRRERGGRERDRETERETEERERECACEMSSCHIIIIIMTSWKC